MRSRKVHLCFRKAIVGAVKKPRGRDGSREERGLCRMEGLRQRTHQRTEQHTGSGYISHHKHQAGVGVSREQLAGLRS